jgi:hypothetical protein
MMIMEDKAIMLILIDIFIVFPHVFVVLKLLGLIYRNEMKMSRGLIE